MTRVFLVLALAATFAFAFAPQQPVASEDVVAVDAGEAEFTYKAQRKWRFRLPAEQTRSVGQAFAFTESLGRSFKIVREGHALLVDVDGDGEIDAKLRGNEGFLTLKGVSSSYGLRLHGRDGAWRFAPGCVMRGKIAGTKVQLIDQNLNGRFDDFGEDAMVVGRSRVASFLSEVISVEGRLVRLQIAPDGRRVAYSNFDGESGSLKMSCSTKAKLLGAVIRSSDGRHSFDVASVEGGLEVPVGDYELAWGEIGLSDTRVKIRRGRADMMSVSKGGSTKVSWGGPIAAEFAYLREDREVQFDPNKIWYYGSHGEEYYDWFPNGKSPTIRIDCGRTGRQIAETFFPGSC